MPQPELTPEERRGNQQIDTNFVEAMRDFVKAETQKKDQATLEQKKQEVVKAAIAYGRTVNMSYFDEIVEWARRTKPS